MKAVGLHGGCKHKTVWLKAFSWKLPSQRHWKMGLLLEKMG